MKVVILKQTGTTVWLKEILKMSTMKSENWSAHSQCTWPGTLSWPAAFYGLNLGRFLWTSTVDRLFIQCNYPVQWKLDWSFLPAHWFVLQTMHRNCSVHLGARQHHNRCVIQLWSWLWPKYLATYAVCACCFESGHGFLVHSYALLLW